MRTGIKWSPEQHAKYSATMKRKAAERRRLAKTATKSNGHDHDRDIYVYLKHARDDVLKRMRNGTLAKPDRAHTLMLLALSEMESRG